MAGCILYTVSSSYVVTLIQYIWETLSRVILQSDYATRIGVAVVTMRQHQGMFIDAKTRFKKKKGLKGDVRGVCNEKSLLLSSCPETLSVCY